MEYPNVFRKFSFITMLEHLFVKMRPTCLKRILLLGCLICIFPATFCLAAQHDVELLMSKAYRYYYGKGGSVSYRKALDLYSKAARLGDADAQFILGGMYHEGLGTEKNKKEAFKWLLKAAEQGRSTAESENILGYSYLQGDGVPQNFVEARRWYEKAATKKHVRAQSNLAYMYYNGLGIKQDFGQAFHWYESAALLGDAQAQYNLGVMYFTGTGVEPDRVRSYAWYSIAASAGNSSAMGARNSLMSEMSWEELAEAQALSVNMFREIENE